MAARPDNWSERSSCATQSFADILLILTRGVVLCVLFWAVFSWCTETFLSVF